jgi:D-alanyl-D-alanine carboxypeptidase/D-alanyl-D-alanine-endopeptidase (penicillin-binding protein 4)
LVDDLRLVPFLLVFSLIASAGIAADSLSALPDFREYVDGLIDHPALRGASWSVLIYSFDGDSIVYQRDPDRRLIPASVAKVVTSAAAMDALGPDYRFTTTVSASRPIRHDGRLKGDLIIQAGGDPTIDAKYVDSLRAPLLRTWADSLHAHGIERIDGDIVMRTWPYRREVNSPDWEVGDVTDRFGPSVDGFGFHSNVCQVAILPGAYVGATAIIAVDPPYAPVELHSTVTTSSADTEPAIDYRLVPEDTIVYLAGEIPIRNEGQYIWISIQDPALYFGRALREALVASGIEVDGGVVVDRYSQPSEADPVLFVHYSEPLSDVLKIMNKESDNYIAEYVLRAIGINAVHVGDLRSGLMVEERFLRALNIDASEVELRDGCGLARQDLVSARGLVDLLRAMYVQSYAQPYLATMAISGVDGTIAFRLSSPELAGKVHAKTGTINHVANLAGYMFGAGGQPFIFAILCNNFPSTHRQLVRVTQDNLLERLYSQSAR